MYGIQELQKVHGIVWNMDGGMIKGIQGKQDKRQSTGTQGIYGIQRI